MKTRAGQSGDVDRRGVAWRSSRGLCLALVALVSTAVMAGAGCLNPRPEELPSSQNAAAAPVPVAGGSPARESCGDNPYLAGCALPGEGVSAPESDPVPTASGYGEPGDAGAGTPADAGVVPDGEAESDAGP